MQLNVYSPRVTTNAMLACLMKRDVDAAFEIYDEFRSRAPAATRNVWTPGLVHTLAAAMRALPKISERMVDELEVGIRAEYGAEAVPSRLSRVLISGYIDTGRFEQAVETFDAMDDRAKTRFSPEGGARVNTALHAVGRDPVEFEVFENAADADGAPKGSASRFVASATESQQADAQAQAAASTVDLPQAEELLELAKLRDWERAVEVLEGIDDSTLAAASAKQATLLFNCALSAAVEEPEAIDKILVRMDERKVPRNTTTYNTAMSALARDAGRWSESISMYQQVPKVERDSSTYSVAFSVFGKRGLWEEATEVFNETRAGKIKLTPAQYSLVVQATHKAAWATSLAAFCDLRKHHGAENIKELVVNRVAKSLEAHGHEADVPRLHEAMKAKGKAAGGGKKKKGA
jgi:pentatricopeptide repeat protein